MGLRKKKKPSFKLYELTIPEIYKIMPKLKKRDFSHIQTKEKLKEKMVMIITHLS